MECYVYRSSRRPETYVYLPRRDDFAALPDGLLRALGRLEFALEFVLTPQRQLARVDPATVLANLEAQGFHIQLPPSDESKDAPVRSSAPGGSGGSEGGEQV
jgi:uncharacterized protein YcgL (UPF0745 family)